MFFSIVKEIFERTIAILGTISRKNSKSQRPLGLYFLDFGGVPKIVIAFLFPDDAMITKPAAEFEEEGFFFEIFVFTPFWEVFFEKFAGHFEADVAFFELLEVVSGVEKEIPDEEILEVVVVFFEGALFFETIVDAFESRENV